MRTRLGISIGLLTVALASQSTAQPLHFWSQGFGNTGPDVGWGVAVDGSGNVFLTGSFVGLVDFGGVNLASAGVDIFLAKYDSRGIHQWSQRFGGSSPDVGYSNATDGSGNVIVTGSFQGTADFGAGSLVSAGLDDIFVAKYNSSGAHQWSQRFGSTSADYGYYVATDGSGSVIVTGSFQGTVNFGGSNLVSAGLDDIFVAKYNSSGVHQWSHRFGSTSSDSGRGLAVDGSGSVLVTGWFQDTVNFGGSNLVSAGLEEIFVAKYNSGGVHQWSQRFGSTGFDVGHFVSTDDSSNVMVTGEFENTVNLGGGGLISAGDRDIFVAKYNSGGVHQWSQRFGDTGTDLGAPLAIDAAGSVILAGSVEGTVDFGGGPFTSAGGHDIFIAKYNSNGAHQWSQIFGGVNDDFGTHVALDVSGRLATTGAFGGEVSFGGDDLVSAGNPDIFLAMFGSAAAEPLITSILDIGNDQGRQVKIRFNRASLDDEAASSPISQYEAYRRDDAPPSTSTSSRDPARLSRDELRADGWTHVGSVAAHAETSYGIDAPTVGDSTVVIGQYYSVFYVRASTGVPSVFFDSPIDSGYSLDNLAPGAPTSFSYSAGLLTWDESAAVDFDYFSIYGSNTGSFASATLIDYTVSPTIDVTASAYVFYFVTTTDFSGNEGTPAIVNTLSAADGRPKAYVLSLSAYPNPFNPTATVRYTLPSRGRVTLTIHDLRGALITTLVNRELDAGAYTVEWDGRADSGVAVSTGVYFGRLRSVAGTRNYKLTLLK